MPEDRSPPLEVLCMMFEVAAGTAAPPSLLNVRRWTKVKDEGPAIRYESPQFCFSLFHFDSFRLIADRGSFQVLIDRALCLGSVDKVSLHDIVLDYVRQQYTADELRLGKSNLL